MKMFIFRFLAQQTFFFFFTLIRDWFERTIGSALELQAIFGSWFVFMTDGKVLYWN
jgi:hypothetical protein